VPITRTYPGVYIEEIPSGVRTITGAATSITAFIGWAARGEINELVTIDNFGDFERVFGRLNTEYPMSYAVRDFYVNGGSQAIVVRLFVRDLTRIECAVPKMVSVGECMAGQRGGAEPKR
jgi:phage tail sheath protein FI